MTRLLLLLSLLASATSSAIAPFAASQAPCRAAAPRVSREANMFTQAQESDLGDAIAARLSRDVRILDEPTLTASLRRIGDRIVAHLPPNDLRFQFFLVDLPEANAFVIPGGRIYVSRKLVAFVKREDELAGVIGHEVGHLVARQQTVALTRQFKDVLNVTSVTDRQDIVEKYNRLMDNAARKPRAFRATDNHSHQDQIEADQLGLFVVAAAGYDPDAHAQLFDRLTETNGDTGGFFSELFGTTAPSARRLREMLKASAGLPAGCADPRGASSTDDFRQWQTAVVAYTGIGRTEALHGVVARATLAPPLRGDITGLRFSPDGRWVLAQDNAGITVLSRDPFATVFHIPAPDAVRAHFTPNSREVAFHTNGLRVEAWDVGRKALVRAHEVVLRTGCLQTELSPDGLTLACLDSDFGVSLFDAVSSERLFQKKAFFEFNALGFLYESLAASPTDTSSFLSSLATLGFSPDGRFFVAGRFQPALPPLLGSVEAALVYDLQAKAALTLKGTARKLIAGGFAFVAVDRLIAQNRTDLTKSALVVLPAGDVVDEFPMMDGQLDTTAKGPHLLVRPFQKFGVGVVDVPKRMVVKGHPGTALDLYDDVFVAERTTGELALYAVGDNKLIAAVNLPRDDFARVRGLAVSADLQWLAVSGHTRGTMWDLSTGTRRLQTPGFRGGAFADDGVFYADFPRTAETPRQVVRIDPRTGLAGRAQAIADRVVSQAGLALIVRKPVPGSRDTRDSAILDVRDIRTPALLWSRTFTKEPPLISADPRGSSLILAWPTSARTVREEIRDSPALLKQLSAMRETAGDYFLEVCDPRTGTIRGKLLIETGMGSFRIDDPFAVGDAVVISDNANRVHVYSITTGELTGRVFGADPVVSERGRLLAVQNGPGQLIVYDMTTFGVRDEFRFRAPVTFSSFSADGTELLVITADQTAIRLKISP